MKSIRKECLKAVLTFPTLASQFTRTTNAFGFLTSFLLRGFLEMLLELHFTKNTLTLKFLFQRTKSLIDVVITNRYLHVVFTTFLSLKFAKNCRTWSFSKQRAKCLLGTLLNLTESPQIMTKVFT
ncbi:hypothetical protein RC74_01795 [Falsihalocynthiibacter arcticus]|uniref:Uncharacterized protein n=1 Tax=Falsihalocynthiibacter arcticus TaxID=1579316 RepID=A0A126UWR2_9RHOB|nr:hypothetical protein RC74_01795 [Falsihalocynthiibacter arcticus]